MYWSAVHRGYVEDDGSPLRTPPARIGLPWRAITFLLIFAALSVAWSSLRGTDAERSIVHHGAVRPAAWLVNLLTPAVQARAVETSIRAPGGGINILNGCEGLDALFLLIAAFCVAPLSWRARLGGLALGLAVVFGVNQLRILALLYAFRADPGLFQPLHGTVAPIVVVLAICGYFYAWLHLAARRPAAPA